ncbi:MAG TPA: hypothetical protein VFA26_05235 [Gemmataceae bacterium]|nr:hypothetical protein [Gemmataceae bacterium]
MPITFRVDLQGTETLDALESGDGPPPGWHRARLEDVFEDKDRQGVVVFQYKGVGGIADGRAIFDRLTDPDACDDPKKAEVAGRRLRLLAKRLGLLTETDCGRSDVEKTWYDALGKEVVLHVTRRAYKDTKTGEDKEAVGVDFAGVYPLDYPPDKLPKSCPAEARVLFAAAAAASGATASNPARPLPAAANGPAVKPSPVPDLSDL